MILDENHQQAIKPAGSAQLAKGRLRLVLDIYPAKMILSMRFDAISDRMICAYYDLSSYGLTQEDVSSMLIEGQHYLVQLEAEDQKTFLPSVRVYLEDWDIKGPLLFLRFSWIPH